MAADTASCVAVIDIGKTNAKVALVDPMARAEIALRTHPNTVRTDGPYPHFDVEALWAFALDALAVLGRERRIEAIATTTHGAACALLDADGALALPVLDYEHDGPDTLAAEYDALRPPFEESGTPRMPDGLNLGAQLYWLSRRFPEAFARTAAIVTWPQYWSFRLSGVAATEVTSLSCHGDLWRPDTADFSSMVDRFGWRRLFAPVREARDRLGPILPEVAARAGLDPRMPVICGVHDSNASLLPHLLSRQPPFSVVSTGTWVCAMSIGGNAAALTEASGAMVNVNALGDPVPSVRFMGGRERAELTVGLADGISEADVAAALAAPDLSSNSGSDGARRAGVSFHLALKTVDALAAIGAAGPIVVDGPFTGDALFLRMLAAGSDRDVIAAGGAADASIGAALLAAPEAALTPVKDNAPTTETDPQWTGYAARRRSERE